jgi:hypothetical protein
MNFLKKLFSSGSKLSGAVKPESGSALSSAPHHSKYITDWAGRTYSCEGDRKVYLDGKLPTETTLPAQCFSTPASTANDLFDSFKAVLPYFCIVEKPADDVLVLLISFEKPQWRGLVQRLYERPACIYLSPEILYGRKPLQENVGDDQGNACLVYSPPSIDGQQVRTGIFVVDRSSFLQAACSVRGIPIFFLQEVKASRKLSGQVEVLVFSATGITTRRISSNNVVTATDSRQSRNENRSPGGKELALVKNSEDKSPLQCPPFVNEPELKKEDLSREDMPGEALKVIESSRPSRGVPKVGRNDPCPCGSGQKYKHCCDK